MLNSISITGYVAFTPETQYLQGEYQITRLVVNVYSGESRDSYVVKCWNKSAEKAMKLAQGDRITLRGEVRFDNWTDKNSGEQRSEPRIHVNSTRQIELIQSKPVAQAVAKTSPKPSPKPAIPTSYTTTNNNSTWSDIPF